MRKPGEFDYFRCSACSLVQLHPVPADMSIYYEAYQVHQGKSWLHETLRRLLMEKAYYAPPKTSGSRILDYGCGDGWFIRDMANRGHQPVGFEPNADHAARLSRELKLPVFSNVVDLEAKCGESFDAVSMHFVLEHLSDPSAAFALARRLLKPGGQFYFTVPNIESVEFRMFGRKWHGFDTPRHISYPTPPIIRRLAEQNSFAVRGMRAFGTPNDVAGSLVNVLAGHYNYHAFCACIPLAVAWNAVMGEAVLAITLSRQND